MDVLDNPPREEEDEEPTEETPAPQGADALIDEVAAKLEKLRGMMRATR
jgi:hypothetical protein